MLGVYLFPTSFPLLSLCWRSWRLRMLFLLLFSLLSSITFSFLQKCVTAFGNVFGDSVRGMRMRCDVNRSFVFVSVQCGMLVVFLSRCFGSVLVAGGSLMVCVIVCASAVSGIYLMWSGESTWCYSRCILSDHGHLSVIQLCWTVALPAHGSFLRLHRYW